MPQLPPCDYCNNDVPPSADRCPHCGLPGLFPNVRAAEAPGERAVLDMRYQSAKTDSSARGVIVSVDDFEIAVASSKAVIACPLDVLQRLVNSYNKLYGSYYELIDGGVQIPEGDKWDKLRFLADDALFLGYRNHIKFAALSLNKIGLSNYGECSIVLRDDMIAHRTSVFEGNSALFMQSHNYNLPEGYRATWKDRAKLCVAKLHKSIDSSAKAEEYSALLLRQGATSEKDEFIEAQIYGPITIRTIEHVTLSPRLKNRATILRAMREKLLKAGVTIS